MNTELINEMIQYYAEDPKRIQHFLKVHSFAKLICEMEKLEEEVQRILETAAIVHDIGIKLAEEKYGNCNGKLQEQEGPPVAEKMLLNLGYEKQLIERVCFLVGHHHTYTEIDGLDYQILIEADFLVNLYEDGLDDSAVQTAYTKIFRTDSGRKICSEMYGIKN